MDPRANDAGRDELMLDLGMDYESRAHDFVPLEVTIAGRPLSTSPVFDTYWRFAALRQHAYVSRLSGASAPWSTDPVLRAHRFTNCYRASDRVSQYLINEVAYSGSQDPEEILFRILLFKFFNKIETWELLQDEFGSLSSDGFAVDRYDEALSEASGSGRTLYSAAYVIPAPGLGATRKHTNHLRLLDHMLASALPRRLRDSTDMNEAFVLLRAFPGIGDFLAFQFLIDINYSTLLNFDEMEYVVAGPGARDGIRKCFGPRANGIEAEVIRYMADSQDEHFARLGLQFEGLRGRPLQLIDCQNLFCETDKYARVTHPDVSGISGRTRIKQKFRPTMQPLTARFPPKWGID
ncbi:conserved hypothetical protein (plasmid) [Rhodococcus jostii RHA1]|uniref:5-hmdU DNA kinase helical domain-containing protein n=1 Tax=Rhodococcus jostii (strain RHA1) TaxID=101510 RepID=Q0RX20_RHOJR|nr:nucleotide kinase domain-containing protein [Rhodococcus jostii]ABH00166.1 conserved hypothetical protein [Rhodococcus jostii RHA1]